MSQSHTVHSQRRNCPRCNRLDVRRSITRGSWERFITHLFGLRPYRCNACLHRFWDWHDRPTLIAG